MRGFFSIETKVQINPGQSGTSLPIEPPFSDADILYAIGLSAKEEGGDFYSVHVFRE